MDLLRQFVIQCKNSLDVKNKIHLAMCALCPILVEVADLDLLCGFIDDLAVFLGDRGFLSTVKQEVVVTEYRGIVMHWRNNWSLVSGNVDYSNGVRLWLSEVRVRGCKVLYRALHLMFSLGESYPELPKFVTPGGSLLSAK